jgi:hypothetical protein
MKAKRAKLERGGCMDPSWRKSRIAARILLRENVGALTARDYRLAKRLAMDPGVENRLIDQALACIRAEKSGR